MTRRAKNIMNHIKSTITLDQFSEILGSHHRNHLLVYYLRIYTSATMAYTHYIKGSYRNMSNHVKKMENDVKNVPLTSEARYVDLESAAMSLI